MRSAALPAPTWSDDLVTLAKLARDLLGLAGFLALTGEAAVVLWSFNR